MGDFTSLEDEHFFGAIGRLTISWAHLELGLDIMIFLAHHMLAARHRDKEIPRALGRKLKYAKHLIRHLPIAPADLPTFEGLIDKIQDESDIRHDLIHGAVIEHEEGSGKAVLTRLIHQKTYWDQKTINADTISILKAANRANSLSNPIFAIVNVLQEISLESRKPTDEQAPR